MPEVESWNLFSALYVFPLLVGPEWNIIFLFILRADANLPKGAKMQNYATLKTNGEFG